MHRTSDQESPFVALAPAAASKLWSTIPKQQSTTLDGKVYTYFLKREPLGFVALEHKRTRTSYQLGCCADRTSQEVRYFSMEKSNTLLKQHIHSGKLSCPVKWFAYLRTQSWQENTSTYLQNWSHLAHQRRPWRYYLHQSLQGRKGSCEWKWNSQLQFSQFRNCYLIEGSWNILQAHKKL